MSAWLTQQRAAFALALRRLWSAPTTTLLAALSIGIALSLPAGGQLLLTSLQQLGQRSATPQVSVFMQLDVDAKAVSKLETRLKSHPAIADIEFVSRAETHRRLRDGGLAQVIDALPRNPFPDTFIVTPHDSSPPALAALKDELSSVPDVAHVQHDNAWAQRLAALLGLGRTVVLLLAVLFGVGLVALIFNTIRLQVLTQREEIELSSLLGATKGYIRRPFYYFGALQGLFGGAVACAIVYASFSFLQQPVANLAELYSLGFQLGQMRVQDLLLVLGVATALGWIGAALSLRRHLRNI